MTKYNNFSYDMKKNKIKNSQILLLINNKRNISLLSKFLDSDYITYSKYHKGINYDLILVDSYYYKTKFKLIKQIKNSQENLFLPVILMYGREEAIDYSSKMMNIADEYILTPVKKAVLKERIKRMLETRELTKEVYQINNKYKKIFDHINEMLFLNKIGFEKRILYPFLEINEKVIEKTGYNKEELLKMKPTDLVYHNKDSHFFNYYFNRLEKDNEVILESELIKKNGQFIKVEINSKVMELQGEKHVLTIMKEI